MSAKVVVSSHHKAISCSIMSWKVLFRFSLILENIKIIGPILILGVIYKQRNIEDPIIPCKEQKWMLRWIIFVYRVVTVEHYSTVKFWNTHSHDCWSFCVACLYMIHFHCVQSSQTDAQLCSHRHTTSNYFPLYFI